MDSASFSLDFDNQSLVPFLIPKIRHLPWFLAFVPQTFALVFGFCALSV